MARIENDVNGGVLCGTTTFTPPDGPGSFFVTTDTEISQDLGVTVNTVKYHVKNLLIKTGYRNAIQLVVDAVNKSLILPKY